VGLLSQKAGASPRMKVFVFNSSPLCDVFLYLGVCKLIHFSNNCRELETVLCTNSGGIRTTQGCTNPVCNYPLLCFACG